MWKKLFKFRKAKSKPELTPIDQLIELVGDEHLEVFNGVTYSGTRNETDGTDDKLDFTTTRWFKIKLGKYVSGIGDWGGGFDRACCAVVEVYVDINDWKILRVCTPQPYYNSPNKERDEELYKKVRSEVENMQAGMLHIRNLKHAWLKGVLETLHELSWLANVDLWKSLTRITLN